MNFRNLAIASALLCFTLSLIWAVAPQILLACWGVPFSYAAGLVGRRNAGLFAGIGIMFYCVRNTPPSVARNAIARGFGISCAVLACLSTFEFVSGHASWGIILAALGELSISGCFAYVLLTQQEHASNSPAL